MAQIHDSNNDRVSPVFLMLAVVGCVLPLIFFVRFLVAEGLNVSSFLRQLFDNNVSTFFLMDVVVLAVTVLVFVFVEWRRKKMPRLWLYVACTLLVGVSLALPLFLAIRERQRFSKHLQVE